MSDTTNETITSEENTTENFQVNTTQETIENTNQNSLDYKEKYEEINDRYLRLYSEFDNFRKRNAKERLELISTASEDVIKNILPVLDDMERAIQANKNIDDIDAIKQGIELLCNKLKNTLHQKGLKEMTTDDHIFNADLHEAITKIPAPSDDLKGKIVDVIEKGYYLNDKIIRFAKVVVGE